MVPAQHLLHSRHHLVRHSLGLTVLSVVLGACGSATSTVPVTATDNRPVVTSISGNMELGDAGSPQPTTVTIVGSHFQKADVAFGLVGPGSDVTVNADGTQITVVAPANDGGRTPIIVSTPNGKVNAGIYTFLQELPRPIIRLLALTPTSGPASGGTTVTFTYDGSLNFSPVPQTPFDVPDVYFGSVKATTVQRSGDTITAVSPGGSGFVNVTFRCPVDTCYTLSNGISEALPFYYSP
ncbi:IPT/TIG domain-containing protein [Deinococcus sp.]|uniref:IPT/TIG domain-containing protein n=1 Tax=Deinococcus sp. TaxID=47478 RepID=UPI002869C730|nr:IPT/TIG domain-containing protein [Deinococcus sp.]